MCGFSLLWVRGNCSMGTHIAGKLWQINIWQVHSRTPKAFHRHAYFMRPFLGICQPEKKQVSHFILTCTHRQKPRFNWYIYMKSKMHKVASWNVQWLFRLITYVFLSDVLIVSMSDIYLTTFLQIYIAVHDAVGPWKTPYHTYTHLGEVGIKIMQTLGKILYQLSIK